LVAGTWVAFPTDLLQTKQLSSLYGFSVIVLVSVLAVIAGTGGFLVYLYFSLRQDFTIGLTQMPESEKLREIHVIVGPNDVRKTEASSYTVNVPVRKWSENYEDINFLIRQFDPQAQEPSTLFPLHTIPCSRNPVMTVPWTRTKEEFESHIDAFASAVNGFAGVRRSRLDMPSGGLPAPFVLFFAYRGFGVIYFPSDAQRTYPLGGEHQLELWVRAKGKRDKSRG
jgi:hypothetical protein